MDVFQAIDARYSYRGEFLDRPVRRDDLVKIVQAGIQAPSGCNEQTTSFVIVDEAELLREIARMVDRPVCNTARAMIVCVVEPRPVYHGFSFHVEDCAAAVENMLLAIVALGYATVWLDGALRLDDDRAAKKIAELLGVPDDRQIRIVLPLGIAVNPAAQKERLPFERRAWFNRFEG